MDAKHVFIYDGECPFCKHFAELLELKSGISNIEFINGRENLNQLSSLLKKGYDLDRGAIILKGDEILYGPEAINWICTKINEPSDSLLELLRVIFTSKQRTNLAFPILVFARRILLTLKGITWKPVKDSIQSY